MRKETQLALTVVLCAALIGSAVLLRDATVGPTGGVMERFLHLSAFAGNGVTGAATEDTTINQPPAYTGPSSLATAMDTPLTVDVALLFSDPEGDALTFLIAEEDQVAVTLDGNVATLTPAAGFVGERVLAIVASDGVSVVREYVRLVVEGSASAPAEVTPQPTEEESTAAPAVNPTDTPTPTPTEESFGTQEFGTSVACTSCADCTTCMGTTGNSCTPTGNIDAAGTCVTVGADNTVLECAGATITFDGAGGGSNAGVSVTARTNVTVRDCMLLDNNSAGTNSAGIELLNTNSSRIINATATANGSSSNFGVNLGSNARNNTIENSTLRTFGSSTNNYAIEINGAHGNSIRGTTVITNGTATNHGLDIIAANNNTLETVNISTVGTGSYGIALNIANGTLANNVTFTNPMVWLTSDTGSFNNFSNTTFWTPNGSVTIPQSIRMNGTHDVTKTKLNITLNRVFVNATNLQFLNASATIALFGITFTDPQPNVDFEDDGSFAACNAPQCTEVSYAGGVFTFNVSSFTTYNSSESATGEGNFTTIAGCAVINGSTKLLNNVTANGTCISFNSHSIFLDCAGFTIRYGNDGRLNSSWGVNITNFQNATVSNCTILKVNQTPSTGSRQSYGIALLNASFARVENNTILTNGSEENNGIHTSGTGSVRVDIVTNNGNVNAPYCVNGTGSTVMTCKVCFNASAVNCANLGQSGCTDGEGFKTETIVSFNISSVDRIPTQGRVTLIGGEAIQCHLNDQQFLSTYSRNTCGAFRSASIPGSFFVAARNNLTCSVAGGGEDEDNGFKLVTFSYDEPAVLDRGANITIRNNTVLAAGGNNTRGVYLDNPFSLLANNTITTNGTNFGHGIYVAAGAQGSTITNNTISARPTGSNGILVVGATNTTFLNNSIANYTLAAVYLDNALNNTFNQSEIPLFGRRSSLYILEPDGSLNFTGTLNITNRTNLAQVINITFNATRVNTSTSAGQQFNSSAILEFFGMPFFGSRPVFDPEDDVSFGACDDPRCVGQNYNLSARIMRFNVSAFTTYAVSELSTCTTLDLDFNVSTTSYTLINNVSSTGTCFSIVGNNITLDCAGFAIYYGGGGGSNVYGVDISNPTGSNTTVTNVTVRNCMIIKNGTSGEQAHGVRTLNTTFVTLVNNNITTRGAQSAGIFIQHSENASVLNNSIQPEDDALRMEGSEPKHWFTNEVNLTNTVLGQNISYFGGAGSSPACPNNAVLTNPATRHITLIRCTGVTLNDFNAADRVTIIDSNYTNITNSNFRNNSRGIALFIGQHATMQNNTFSTLRGSQPYAVHLRYANFTNITFNRIQTDGNASGYGILLEAQSYNGNISQNNITTNGSSDSAGIVLGSSAGSNIQGNNITTNGSGAGNKGIVLNSSSENSTVIANVIVTNGSSRSGGIEAMGSNNNITANTVRTSTADFGSFNFGIGIQNGANNDISFNDIETSGSGDGANGINATNVNNSRFINNTIRATGSDTLRGIWVRANANNNLFHNNTIRTEAFFGSPGYAIELNNATNSSVMGNNISTNGTDSAYGVYVFLSEQTTIAYNTIRTQGGNTGNGIDVDGTATTLFSHYVFIIGNNITAGHGAGSNTGIAIEEARFVIIENNTIFTNSSTGCCNPGIDTSSFSFRVNVTGNTITTAGGTTGVNNGIDISSVANASVRNNIVTTNGGSSSDGIVITADNMTIVNNTFFIHAVSSAGINIGGTSATAVRNRTSTFIDNRIHVNSTDSRGINVLGLAFPERHVFNHTILNVTGTWIRAEGGSGTRLQGNFSLNFTNTTFLNENGSIRFPGSFILNFSRVYINQSNLNITRNRAFMNATNTTYLKNNTNDTVNMNQSAVITLRFVSLGEPLAAVDFEDDGTFVTCPATNCTDVTYADGVLTFNVTSFTTYSSTEGGLNVSLTKTDSPDPVNASGFLNYTITINVSSTNNASNVTLTDLYPAQVIFLSSQPDPTNGNNTFIIGNLTNGSSFSVNISVLVNNGTEGVVLNNTANISYQNRTGSLLFFNVTENTTVNTAAAFACGTAITANTTLTQNLSCTGTGVVIGTDNVTLDCAGYTILYDSAGLGRNAISIFNAVNVVVRDCTLIDINASGAAGTGINATNGTGSRLLNNTIQTNGTTNNFGILLRGTIRNATIANNTIRTRGNVTINDGIRLDGLVTASNNLIEGNVITTNGSSSNNGIYLLNSNENSTVRGNVITAGTSGSQNQGIFLEVRPKNNSIHNNTIFTSGTSSNYGIDLTGNNADGSDAVNNRIFNNSVRTNGTTDFNDGIVIDRAQNSTVTDNTVVAGSEVARDSNGIILYDSERINLTRNVLTTIGNNSENDGIELSSNVNALIVEHIRINTSGTQAYGIRMLDSNHSQFSHIVLNDTREWLFANQASANNTLTNTTFATPLGSIRIMGNFSMQPFPVNVSRSKLNVTQNRSFLNTTNLSFMNVSAQVSLNGVLLTDPRPVIDTEDDGTFADCAVADCQEISYAGSLYVFNVSHFTSHAAGETAVASTNLTSCAVVNASASLAQNLIGNGSCIIINASNLFFNCSGREIQFNANGGDNAVGVLIAGANNVTIRDCIIRDLNESGSGSIGINATIANGTLLLNNTIFTNGTTESQGIFLRTVNATIVENNTVRVNGTTGQNGLQVAISDNSVIRGNALVIPVGTSTRAGVYSTQSTNTTVAFNQITHLGSSGAMGIRMDVNTRSTAFSNNVSIASTGATITGISIGGGTFNNVTANNVSMLGTSGSPVKGIDLFSGASQNVVDFNIVHVNGTTGPLHGIHIRFAASNDNNFTGNSIRIETAGTAANGIVVEDASQRNRFSFTNITTRGVLSYGVMIFHSNGTAFDTTVMNASAWINQSANALSNFTDTAFETANGSIRIIPRVPINGTQDINKSTLNVVLNNSFLNSTNLSFMNVSAQITLRGITLTDPKPVIDTEDDGTFADCAAADCQELSYASNVYVFNVSHFTSHAAGENSSTPPPPPPAPSGGGGGGGSGSRGFSGITAPSVVAPAQEAVAPEVQQPLACAEDWDCQDWSPCAGGTQSRVCADRSACGTVELRPLLSQSCVPERTPVPQTEQPASPLVPKSIRYSPQLRPCMALALGIDAVLVIIAVILLLVLANHARRRDSSVLLIVLDTLLAIALALVLAQRSACNELLPLQYAAFVILALAAVFIHLFRQLGRRDGKPAYAQKLFKPARVKQLPAPKAQRKAVVVPAPPAPPKKQVIVLERPEPAAITRLRTGPSVWQRLSEVTRRALAPKPKLPQVPDIKPVKGVTGTAQLPKKLQRTLDASFRKAKVTDIPDLRSEFGAIASSEDLLREFNKSVRKMKRK